MKRCQGIQQLWQPHLLQCSWLKNRVTMRATRVSHHMAPLQLYSLIFTLTEQIEALHQPCCSGSSQVLQPWLTHRLCMKFGGMHSEHRAVIAPQALISSICAPVTGLVECAAAPAFPHAVAGRGVDHYAPLAGCPIYKCLLCIHLHSPMLLRSD